MSDLTPIAGDTGTPNVRQEARHQLACTNCRQPTRTVLYVVAATDLVAVLEGCTICRSGIHHAQPTQREQT